MHEHILLGMVAIVHCMEIERNTFRKQIVIQTKNVFLGFVQNDAINIRFIDWLKDWKPKNPVDKRPVETDRVTIHVDFFNCLFGKHNIFNPKSN